MMRRRDAITSLAIGAFAALRVVHAQGTRKLYRIGILAIGGATATAVGPQPPDPYVSALLRGMSELGYAYGVDFITEPRSPEGHPERIAALAAELVGLPVDVIVSGGGPVLAAFKQATSTIPVVMAASIDPVGLGFAKSLALPGGNFTGLSLQTTEMTGKRLELLKELAPSAAPVAVLWDRTGLADRLAAEAAAGARGWKLLSLEVRADSEIESALQAADRARAGALLVLGSGIFFPHARRIAEIAMRSRLPTMFALRPYVEAGGLMSYGADLDEIWHRSAYFVDRILKGANPAELPVEQPSKFELVINLKTARILGLAVPQSLLLRADKIIE